METGEGTCSGWISLPLPSASLQQGVLNLSESVDSNRSSRSSYWSRSWFQAADFFLQYNQVHQTLSETSNDTYLDCLVPHA